MKAQSAFGRTMGRSRRSCSKKDYALLEQLNRKKNVFLAMKCVKELHDKIGKDKNVDARVLKPGNYYSIYTANISGLDTDKKYWMVTDAPVKGQITTIPGSLFFEEPEIKEYFDTSTLDELGVTLADAPAAPGMEMAYERMEKVEDNNV